MTNLQAYRDDGPLAAWVRRRLARDRTGRSRFAWMAPPALRLLEYGALIALTATSDTDAMPACFGLLGVLAFHHYDIVYRLRHQGVAPPRWVYRAGGGWEGRILVVAALTAAGALDVGLAIGAVGLGAMYVTESIASWRRFVRGARPSVYEDEDLEAAA